MKVIVKQNQTIQDIAVMYTGSTDNVLDILLANNKADITLLIGEELKIPDELVSKKHIRFYEGLGLDVGTSPVPLDEGSWEYEPDSPGLSANVRVNGAFFKTGSGTIDVPVKNTEGNEVSVSVLADDKVVVDDIIIQISLNGTPQTPVSVPVGENVTINLE